MKSFRFLLGIALIGLLFVLSGCPGPSPTPDSPELQQTKKLAKAWVCTSATLNGSPVTLPPPNASYNYVGTFKLTMTANSDTKKAPTYTTAGRPTGSKVTPWPISGNFEFGTDVTTTLIRKDPNNVDIIVSYSVSDTQLQMSFSTGGMTPPFTGYDGRVENVQGNWVFTFGL